MGLKELLDNPDILYKPDEDGMAYLGLGYIYCRLCAGSALAFIVTVVTVFFIAIGKCFFGG